MAVALSLFFLFAGVAAILLLHLFVAGRALRRRRRRHLHHSLDPNPSRHNLFGREEEDRAGLSLADLKNLPAFDFSAAMGTAMTPSDCAVCLDGFRDGDRCRRLPLCAHDFHRDCVDRWLMRSPACPICRHGVLMDRA